MQGGERGGGGGKRKEERGKRRDGCGRYERVETDERCEKLKKHAPARGGVPRANRHVPHRRNIVVEPVLARREGYVSCGAIVTEQKLLDDLGARCLDLRDWQTGG